MQTTNPLALPAANADGAPPAKSTAPSAVPLPAAATHQYKGLECAPRNTRLFVNVAQAGSLVFPGETVVATLFNDSPLAKRIAVSLVGTDRMNWSFFSHRMTDRHGVAGSILASGVGIALAATTGVGFIADMRSTTTFDRRIPVETAKELYAQGPTRTVIESGASGTFTFTVPASAPPSFVARGKAALGDTGIFHELVIVDGKERYTTALRVGVGSEYSGNFSEDNMRVIQDATIQVPGGWCIPPKMRVAFSVPGAWLLKSERCQERCVFARYRHLCGSLLPMPPPSKCFSAPPTLPMPPLIPSLAPAQRQRGDHQVAPREQHPGGCIMLWRVVTVSPSRSLTVQPDRSVDKCAVARLGPQWVPPAAPDLANGMSLLKVDAAKIPAPWGPTFSYGNFSVEYKVAFRPYTTDEGGCDDDVMAPIIVTNNPG